MATSFKIRVSLIRYHWLLPLLAISFFGRVLYSPLSQPEHIACQMQQPAITWPWRNFDSKTPYMLLLCCSACHLPYQQRSGTKTGESEVKRPQKAETHSARIDQDFGSYTICILCIYVYYNDIHCTCFSLLKSFQTFSHMSSCVQMLQTMVGQRQIHLLRSWPKNCKNVSRNYKSWRPQGPMRRRLLISEWKHVEIRFLERNIKKSIPSSQVNAWSVVPLFTSDILLRQSM